MFINYSSSKIENEIHLSRRILQCERFAELFCDVKNIFRWEKSRSCLSKCPCGGIDSFMRRNYCYFEIPPSFSTFEIEADAFSRSFLQLTLTRTEDANHHPTTPLWNIITASSSLSDARRSSNSRSSRGGYNVLFLQKWNR